MVSCARFLFCNGTLASYFRVGSNTKTACSNSQRQNSSIVSISHLTRVHHHRCCWLDLQCLPMPFLWFCSFHLKSNLKSDVAGMRPEHQWFMPPGPICVVKYITTLKTFDYLRKVLFWHCTMQGRERAESRTKLHTQISSIHILSNCTRVICLTTPFSHCTEKVSAIISSYDWFIYLIIAEK